MYNRDAIIVIRGTARSQSVRKEREASGEGRRDRAHYSFGQFVERVGSGAARRWEMTPRYRFYQRLLPFPGAMRFTTTGHFAHIVSCIVLPRVPFFL